MPVYEYCCPKCNAKFELLRPASRADEIAICEHCQSPGHRVLSTFATIRRGAGGETAPMGGGAPSCGGCSATSCATCR
ncbi:MAG: zinc ribbon domain-containing protein [Chloroflexi bacterium]|nr:zinc ribbon domain-containing protein [Chloroflexota bacterium]